MRESETGAEQARELESLRSTVEAFMTNAKNASPDKLRQLRAAIEGLSENRAPVAPSVEAKDQNIPSGIESFIAKWNRGEAYESGNAIGSLWFVRTTEGKVYVLPNPSERSKFAGADIAYYYDLERMTKLNEQQLVQATELFVGNEGMSEGDYLEFIEARRKQYRVPQFDIVARGKFSV